MNVTLRMIDKQLRLVGVLMRLFMRNRSEKSMRRKDWSRLFFAGRKPNDLQCQEKWISRGDGSIVRVVVYKPLTGNDTLPGVLWIHGGGYVLGG